MRDLLFWVGVAALVGVIGWGTYYLSADCAKHGGVLIKGYGGNPVCVDRAKGGP